MPSWILIGLVATNIIWAANPIFQKSLLETFDPIQVGWMRFVASFAAYLVYAAARPKGAFIRPSKLSPKYWGLVAIISFSAFCLGPVLQMSGLVHARAVDTVIIILMEPLAAIGLAAVLLRERLSLLQIVSIGLAILGFALLSGIKIGDIDARGFGSLLILLSLIGEALFTVLGRILAQKVSGISVYGTTQGIGLIFLTVVCLAGPGLPDLLKGTTSSWLSLLWIGPIGTALTYGFWSWALGRLSVATISLTLFIQPVIGVILGYLLLDERLTLLQGMGGALIVAAVCLPFASK